MKVTNPRRSMRLYQKVRHIGLRAYLWPDNLYPTRVSDEIHKQGRDTREWAERISLEAAGGSA